MPLTTASSPAASAAPSSTPTHRLLPSPAGRIHLVEQGSGPLVLLLHGFPESWYAWRYQLAALASAGYRAVAIDVRGYGRSSKPEAVEEYRMLDLIADNVAVVEGLGERSAVVVGHDWGATIAAMSTLTRPDVFRAVGLLGVPYTPPGGPRPSEVFARMSGADTDEGPGGEGPGIEEPGGERPGVEGSLGATPGGTTSGGGTTPGDSASGGDAPGSERPGTGGPGGEVPAAEGPDFEALPAEEPGNAAPSGTAPVGTAPGGTTPVGTAPGGTASASTAPAGTAPDGKKSSGAAGDRPRPQEFYVSYFQRPGRAEAEMEPDVRGWLAGFYAALSADTMPAPGAPDPHFTGAGGTLRERFPVGVLPSWLGEGDLDVYAGEFERTGMTGALNRYRNMDRDWADLARWAGQPITRPSLFIGGERDASLAWLADAVKAYPETLPGLLGSHILDGCGHFVQQERPEETNRILLDWLASLPA
ncbi:hypothetical protein GCM10010360_49870 [Streptomyces nogalater]